MPNASVSAFDFGSLPRARLRSRRGAPRIIYLDFNGHTTVNTSWADGGVVDIRGFDIDGKGNTWNDEERRRIIAIHRAVSEDFAGFDVDVTTGNEQPRPSGSRTVLARPHASSTALAPS